MSASTASSQASLRMSGSQLVAWRQTLAFARRAKPIMKRHQQRLPPFPEPAMTEILETPEARHRVRRLGLHRAACRAGAGQARLPHPRRHAPARPCRPSAAARQCRADPGGAGQYPRALVGRPRRRRRRPRHQPRRHPVRIRPPEFQQRAGFRRPRRRGSGARRQGQADPRLGDRRRPRNPGRSMRAPRRAAKRRCWRR